MSLNGAVVFALATGNTVRVPALKGLHFILVVGDNEESMWWFSRIPRINHPMLRYFMTSTDLKRMQDRLPLRLTISPAFLVSHDGWMVDWFPAVPPADGTPLDEERYIVRLIHDRVQSYR